MISCEDMLVVLQFYRGDYDMLTIEMDNFDLGQICRSGQCFRMDQIGDDRYRVIAGDKYLELTQERGIVNFFCPEQDFIFFWIRYFDLDCDYSEYINKINPRDKYLTAAGVFRKQERIKQNHIVQLHRTAEQHRMLHQMLKMYEKVQCRIRRYRIPGEIKKHQIFRMLQKENVL